ncbi:MAG: peptidyl-prolyl cis-trans isomerase [Candidatus Marinimicrobia bacterium]|nr:peptidyl-prolyl cis-trans isomerase [Candidatus Neomarinimicrobiota bacterium]MBL7023727.1 peptidyl-prolyl cis-trans isomerase [Candidatus Neomarinimicrobiota bacterium]MBL7109508.1 peptidyl-prolyl cis-trans isomerase [Candidatus Neomarinimicrobiota bacterium]
MTEKTKNIENPIVIMETSKGTIEIELNKEKAPITVKNFLTYVEDEFFNGTIFHRVIGNFMIQGGGFTPDGERKETLPPIKLESDNGLSNKLGTIAMARTGDPNSATSQFFINVRDNNMLDFKPGNPGYAVFGKVIDGMDVVENIKAVQTTTKMGMMRDWPVDDVIIEKVFVK